MTVANDLTAPGIPASGWQMTVFELAIFMSVLRARQPPRLEEICAVSIDWFECAIDPFEAWQSVSRMLAHGWLAEEASRLRATEQGRRVVRPLMNGVIRMLDQGTRLLDVALMMAVLRLTQGELDHDVCDD